MCEFEKFESERIRKLLVRGETEIYIKDGIFYKNMNVNEVLAYGEISPFRVQLLQNANLQIPEFCGMAGSTETDILRSTYDVRSSDLFKLSYLSGLRHKEFDESFGVDITYDQDDFRFIFECMSKFRRIVHPISKQFEDYEDSAIELLKSSKPKVDSYNGFDSKQLFDSIKSTADILKGEPLIAAHRDLNWNNMEIIKDINGNKTLQLADWGSFGLAYEGYDEGRLFTRLCLNSKQQEDCLNGLSMFLMSDLNLERSFKYMVSFWRTAAIRSYREMHLTINGRYDKLIKDKFGNGTFKSDFIRSLENTVNVAVDNLVKII